MTETKATLKLLVDTKENKVLFAEAGKHFVDFLFFLLSLPNGTIVKLVKHEEMVGCIGDLYQSFDTFESAYLKPNQNIDSLVKAYAKAPGDSFPLFLPSDALSALISPPAAPRRYYRCSNDSLRSYATPYASCQKTSVTTEYGKKCSTCNFSMTSELSFVGPNTVVCNNEGGGYVKDLVSYMVSDDLTVKPMSLIGGISLLNKCKVKELHVLEERLVDVGIEEGVELLKASLRTKEALTSVFLDKKVVDDMKPNTNP